VLATVELMLAGRREAGSAWAPLNAVAPLLLDSTAAEQRHWHPVVTPVGLGITLAGIAGWGIAHHLLMQRCGCRARPAAAIGAASLSAGALAVFDYGVLPPRRRPRFSRWLSPVAIAGKYAAVGAGIALASLLVASRRAPAPPHDVIPAPRVAP
jgi:hypothetical protein